MTRFIIKLIANGVVLFPLLMSFTNATVFSVLLTCVVISTLGYVLGDQLILKATSNIIASIADAGLFFIVLLVISFLYRWMLSINEALICAVVLTVVEFFLHALFWKEDRDPLKS